MRTTINVKDSIINDLIKYYNAKTITESVNKSLQEWVMYLRKKKLLDIRGKIDIFDNLPELKNKELEDINLYE